MCSPRSPTFIPTWLPLLRPARVPAVPRRLLGPRGMDLDILLSHCPWPPMTAEEALTTACCGYTLLCTNSCGWQAPTSRKASTATPQRPQRKRYQSPGCRNEHAPGLSSLKNPQAGDLKYLSSIFLIKHKAPCFAIRVKLSLQQIHRKESFLRGIYTKLHWRDRRAPSIWHQSQRRGGLIDLVSFSGRFYSLVLRLPKVAGGGPGESWFLFLIMRR